MPFYHSTQLMNLGPIAKDAYFDFANLHFAKAGRSLDRSVFEWTYEAFEGITWYVQAVMNRLYADGGERPSVDDAKRTVDRLVREGEYEFQTILGSCTDGGVRFLKAIAREGAVREVNAGAFIARHGLKAASSVNASLRSLREADLVTDAAAGLVVYDRLFGRWLAQLS